jgi:hypothetical protein
MSMKKVLLLAVGTSLLFAGCSKIERKLNKLMGAPTPTPVATAVPKATATPKPTATPKATATPKVMKK